MLAWVCFRVAKILEAPGVEKLRSRARTEHAIFADADYNTAVRLILNDDHLDICPGSFFSFGCHDIVQAGLCIEYTGCSLCRRCGRKFLVLAWHSFEPSKSHLLARFRVSVTACTAVAHVTSDSYPRKAQKAWDVRCRDKTSSQ
jgi:hypothetical protein